MNIHILCFVEHVSMLRRLFPHKDTECSLIVWVTCNRQNGHSTPMLVASIYHIQYHFVQLHMLLELTFTNKNIVHFCIAHTVRNVSGKILFIKLGTYIMSYTCLNKLGVNDILIDWWYSWDQLIHPCQTWLTQSFCCSILRLVLDSDFWRTHKNMIVAYFIPPRSNE